LQKGGVKVGKSYNGEEAFVYVFPETTWKGQVEMYDENGKKLCLEGEGTFHKKTPARIPVRFNTPHERPPVLSARRPASSSTGDTQITIRQTAAMRRAKSKKKNG